MSASFRADDEMILLGLFLPGVLLPPGSVTKLLRHHRVICSFYLHCDSSVACDDPMSWDGEMIEARRLSCHRV